MAKIGVSAKIRLKMDPKVQIRFKGSTIPKIPVLGEKISCRIGGQPLPLIAEMSFAENKLRFCRTPPPPPPTVGEFRG